MMMTSRRFRHPCSSLWICFGLALMIAWITPSLIHVHAKEVVATNDWTLLGENDTVAAGMHVRMNLETGQKWVKLPSSEDGDDARDKDGGSNTLSTHSEDSRMSSSQRQSSSTSSAFVVTVNGESADTSDRHAEAEDSAYDYDMMHRTLSQLPDEEKARIELPDAPQSSMTQEQRAAFEDRMKRIWLRRQEELKRFEQEFVADMPQILRDRIARLQQYVNDPFKELLEMVNERAAGGDDAPGEDASVVTHIVSVLADLEYHLSDIDMTRDFYTLGGWPLLVSLVHHDTHEANANQTAATASTAAGDDPSPLAAKVHMVQAHAAWALGTAVKNTGEFAPFVVEPLQLPGQPAAMSALQVLLDQLSNVDLVDSSKPLQDKVHKYLYALGSFVRGNPLAQRQFVALKGTAALEGLVDVHVPTISKASSRKIVHRVVSLVDDLIRETSNPSRQQPEVSDDLVRGLSTPVWCESTALLLATPPTSPSAASILHPSLRLAGAAAPRCQQNDDDWSDRVRAAASNLLRHWQEEADAARSGPAAEDPSTEGTTTRDPADLDEVQEGIDLAQSVLAVLERSIR